MAGWRSNGFSPIPSAGTGLARANGVSRKISTAQKKAAMPSRTAVA
jgi:hypothetical protein